MEMALKNSVVVMGIVTWVLLAACNRDSKGTTAQDTASGTMDRGAESVNIFPRCNRQRCSRSAFGWIVWSSGWNADCARSATSTVLLDPSVFVARASGAESPVGACQRLRTRKSEGLSFSLGSLPAMMILLLSGDRWHIVDHDGVDAKGVLIKTWFLSPLALPSYWLSTTSSPIPTGSTDECPADTDHIIKTTWEGGVSSPEEQPSTNRTVLEPR